MSTYSAWRSDQGNMQALSEELEAQAAMARSREAALNRRLRSLEGDLSSRVDVLQGLVNALIELGEVREELALFTPARRARDAARALTRAVVAGEGDVSHLRRSPDLVDVPGYWLVPAVLAVADARDGVLDAEAAEEALLRDRRRAAAYLVAVCTLVGFPGLASAWLPVVLDAHALPDARWGTADGAGGDARDAAEPEVTVVERALWVAAASGALGGDGDAVVRDALRRRVDLLDAAGHDRLRGRLLAAPPALGGGGDAWGTAGGEAESAAVRAWAAWADALADVTETAGPSASTEASTGTSAGDEAGAEPDLLDVVASLVDEGAPVERDLLDRADALSVQVGRAPAEAERAWSAAAGPLVDLLAHDASGTDVARARLVAPLVAEDLRAAAVEVSDRLAAEPAPTRTLRLAGRTIEVTPAEDGSSAAAAALAELDARPVQGVSWAVVGGAAVAAVAGVVLAVAVAPAWWLAAIGGAVVAVWQWFAGTARAAGQRDHVRRERERLDAEIVEARAAVRAAAERDDARREQVARAVERLDATLRSTAA
ncbi:hypothetical protein [Cellulosimicrobium marinum]|uniref:hypothetical protein n=1 Tax=Cellulosimicrobium marinum TaxID=1638992 RepID=UPI001E3E2A08|nr:hypothetical protein [Cellulosimicrobium marinum]MCB7136007.1 hypothetical protein [Cellulosimicrobium marinum]